MFSTASTWKIQILQLQPRVPRAALTLWHCLCCEADETPDGGEFFRSSGIHLLKWKEEPEAGFLVASALQFLLFCFISTEEGSIKQVSKNEQVRTVLERH